MTQTNEEISFRPIGHLESWFRTKNGTPRQATVCAAAKAKLTISKSVFTRPVHALEGLKDFSHVWLIFLFHENKSNHVRAKVAPPRLNGKRVGVFSTRSPHRPNPIGLTLVQLDKIEDGTLYFNGVDILDGTPILDVKPYIPQYDRPCAPRLESAPSAAALPSHDDVCTQRELPEDANATTVTVKTPDWINSPPVHQLHVRFTPTSEEQLKKFSADSADPRYRLQFLEDVEQVRQSIGEILRDDPRSVYRRNGCQDRLYYFTVDSVHLTCWFDDDERVVEILKIKPG